LPPAQVYVPADRPPEGDRAYGPPARYDRVPPPEDRGNGERVRVEPGDTLYSLARRYGVTVDMIARANGLTSYSVRPGQTIYIPRADPAAYGPSGARAPAAQTAACTAERCYVVKPGDTVASIARAHGTTAKQIAEANGLQNRHLKTGQTIVLPSGAEAQRRAFASAQDRAAPPAGRSDAAPAPAPAAEAPAARSVSPAPAPAPLQPPPAARTAEYTPAQDQACEAALMNPLPRMSDTFRRPVEGKTIAVFGPQKDGTVNEGVTISVPKGTPIKAAENGIVAYVGDELPGYGNLILIRHAGEFVTAYAHADAILVKKCDVVKRGQTVATAGTTGDASQPQLHFEIRKNSKPVDPMPLLGS
jgi:murein DD-endopeptidase MepM/ murein hydrolase activator NlpD